MSFVIKFFLILKAVSLQTAILLWCLTKQKVAIACKNIFGTYKKGYILFFLSPLATGKRKR